VQVVDLRLNKGAGIERPTVARWQPARDDELGMCLDHVVLLHERLFGELPVHRYPAGVPPLGPQRRHLPRVEDRGERLDALPQRRGVVVQVDPGAPTPHLAAHGGEVQIFGRKVVHSEGLGLGDETVLAIRSVAPPVEGADETAFACPSTLDDPDPAVAACILKRPDAQILGADHDNRLVQNFVLGEVVGLGDLLESACHLPHTRPKEIPLHLEEIGVVVALFPGAVRELHRIRHR
jgi:hypothetical protein